MADKSNWLAKGQNISIIPNWLMLNNAIRTGNLQVLAKMLKQAKPGTPSIKPNAHSFIFAIWSANPAMLEEVVKIAKKRHGMDYVPDAHSLCYAVLCGNLAMVDKILEMAAIRKRELQASLLLLNAAVWSNNPEMVKKVLTLPQDGASPLPSQVSKILELGEKKCLTIEILDAIATSGNSAMLFKMLSVGQKYSVTIPAPGRKTLCNAIKAGNFQLVEEIFKLAAKNGMALIIDHEMLAATDWSDNPAMKSYLENLKSETKA